MVDKQDFVNTWAKFKEKHIKSTTSPFERDFYLAQMCYKVWVDDSVKSKTVTPSESAGSNNRSISEPKDFWNWLNFGDGRPTQIIRLLSWTRYPQTLTVKLDNWLRENDQSTTELQLSAKTLRKSLVNGSILLLVAKVCVVPNCYLRRFRIGGNS